MAEPHIRLLLVEDDPDIAYVLKAIVHDRFNAAVELAGSIATARENLGSSDFDVVLLDYRMPDGDGLQLLEEINSRPDPPPVVLITGQGAEQLVVDAFRLGATGYVIKGSDLRPRLIEAVENAITRNNLRRAEAELSESRARLSNIFQYAGIGIELLDERGNVIQANPLALSTFGFEDVEELSRAETRRMSDPDDFEQERDLFMKLSNGEMDKYTIEKRFQRRDGDFVWGRNTVSAVRNEDGEFVMAVSMLEDITSGKEAREALERERALVESALDAMVDVFFVIDMEGGLVLWNKRVNETLGYTDDELAAFSLKDERFGPDAALVAESIDRVAREVKVTNLQTSLATKAGLMIPYEFSAALLKGASGEVTGICWIGRDVTERRLFEERLDSSLRQLRALAARIQSVREEERTLVARKIHDELGQALTALKMDLSWIEKRRKTQDPEIAGRISSMSNLIDENIQLVRKIAMELRPGILDDLGLLAAVEWQAQEFQLRTGIECCVDSDIEDKVLDPDLSVAVFRIFQEALTNVARHAEASRVDVSLRDEDGNLVLMVGDDGKGAADSDLSSSGSLGVVGMRERAYIVGGELEIFGRPGEGTLVRVRVPLG